MSENNTPDSKDSRPSVARPLLNITSAIISALPAVDPRLLAVPVIASVVNEIGAFFDAASIERRLHELEVKLNEQTVSVDRLQERLECLDEYGRYVFRNNLKHLCLTALPETTDTLINSMIAYLMEDAQEMDEEICEIVSACNANDIRFLKRLKQFLEKGERTQQNQKYIEAQQNAAQSHENDSVGGGFFTPTRWQDRNVIYGENTIFWKDFTKFFNMINIDDMGRILNQTAVDRDGNENMEWAYLMRSLLKFQNLGVVQVEFRATVGTISANHVERFHITLFGQRLLKYI